VEAARDGRKKALAQTERPEAEEAGKKKRKKKEALADRGKNQAQREIREWKTKVEIGEKLKNSGKQNVLFSCRRDMTRHRRGGRRLTVA
jgi:hypothetical protein